MRERLKKIRTVFILAAALLARVGFAAPVYNGADIYNVQNYSSSPFFSPDGAYNQRFPTPVYVKGPQIGAAECQAAVSSAIWTQCSFRNNCAGVSVSDIRPGVMLELSNRTDANYTACQGYIDGIFEQFKRQNTGNVVPSAFPTASGSASSGPNAANPFVYSNLTPQYEQKQDAREWQLQAMQMQATPQVTAPTPTTMPTTFADLSFTDRMDALREGWQDPSVNKKPSYQQITNLESDESMYNRQQRELEAKFKREQDKNKLAKEQNLGAWCAGRSYDSECAEWLKNTDYDKWCKTNPVKCKEEMDARLEIEDRRKLDSGEMTQASFCRRYPNNPICPKPVAPTPIPAVPKTNGNNGGGQNATDSFEQAFIQMLKQTTM